jgi:hypothetical protein
MSQKGGGGGDYERPACVGVAEVPRAGGTVDRGAHHMGARLSPSTTEARTLRHGCQSTHRVGWGVAEAPRRGAGDRGRSTWASVCRPPFRERRAPPHAHD